MRDVEQRCRTYNESGGSRISGEEGVATTTGIEPGTLGPLLYDWGSWERNKK